MLNFDVLELGFYAIIIMVIVCFVWDFIRLLKGERKPTKNGYLWSLYFGISGIFTTIFQPHG